MAATHTWIINNMSVNVQYEGETDVVYFVTWSCLSQELYNGVTYSTNYFGDTSFRYQTGQQFTPYDQLTQAQVLQWVWDSPEVDKMGVEALNQAAIDQQINPQRVSLPLPW